MGHGVDRNETADGSGAAVTPLQLALFTAKGDILVGQANGAVDNLSVGANDRLLMADSAQSLGVKWATPAEVRAAILAAITAKGNLLVGTAADAVAALAVGANGRVLTAASGQTTGMEWAELPLPRSYLAGGTLSNNGSDATNDIDAAAGVARDSTNAANISWSALTKRLDAAWAAGTNAGGLDTGSIANTTYHVFAIRKDSDGTGDILFSASATAPTMPAGYTYFRRIGSILRESASIVAFSQVGDEFLRKATGANAGTNNPGTSAVIATLHVPTGIQVIARFLVRSNAGAGIANRVYVSSLDQTDEACGTARCNMGSGSASETDSAEFHIRTNTSGQIRYRLENSDANSSIAIATVGWFDRRGRDD